MTSICYTCDEELEQNEEIVCGGVCGKKFHFDRCAKLNKTTYKSIKENRSIKWFCLECTSVIDSIYIKMNFMSTVLTKYDDKFAAQEEKIGEMKDIVKELKIKVGNSDTDIKNEIKKVCNIRNEKAGPSYADILKTRKKDPAVILVPKNDGQRSETTKAEIKRKMNPENFGVSGIRNAAKGSVVIECKTNEDLENLKKDVESKLGGKYDIQMPKIELPKVKIFGINQKYSDEKVIELVKKQNELGENVQIKIVKNDLVKNKSYYVVIMEVDGATFNKLMQIKKINVGWDRCPIYEEITVDRCYKCEGFFHKASKCKNKIACPVCAGEHELKDCTTRHKCCINCKSANEKFNMKLDTNHPAWSKSCAVYLRKLDMMQNKIHYVQQ
jgi:hypothetical protein